jgi:hypothetical protein
MTSQISCSYQVTATGAVQVATLQAEVAAVPIPPVQLAEFGLRVATDTTSSLGSVITRTIVLAMNPVGAATAVATLFPGDRGSPLESIAVTFGGSGYVQPPIVSFTGGGIGASSETMAPAAHAVLTGGVVTAIVIDNPGFGFTSPPTVVLTPLFHAMFPDTTDQASTVKNWMTGVFQQALRQPIVAAIPVVS